jgi:hypothetical protein
MTPDIDRDAFLKTNYVSEGPFVSCYRSGHCCSKKDDTHVYENVTK